MFLAGCYKWRIHFWSVTVDVGPWPTSLYSCVVFYDDWIVDFAVGHRTVTVFDVDGMLPHHHVQVLYPALLSLLCLVVILEIDLFSYPSKLSQTVFEEVCFCVLLVFFLIIPCCSLYYYSNTETKTLI